MLLERCIYFMKNGIPGMFTEILRFGTYGDTVIRDYQSIDLFQKFPDPNLTFFAAFIMGHQALPRKGWSVK
jgi:hypothetical protein